MIKNYNELTIKQFLQCKAISNLEPDPIQRKVKMLATITGRDEKEIEELPIAELIAQVKEFSRIEHLQPGGTVDMKFRVKGRRFEVIWKHQQLQAGQYIDASHFCKDPSQYAENIHNILAAICVQRTWYGRRIRYDGTKHKEIADLFYNHMKIAQAYPVMLFFCRYFEALESNTLISLRAELDQISIQSGVGLSQ